MRENVQRRIVVQSNVSGRDLRSVVNDIQARVGQNVRLPQGYHVEYGGQFESEAQASTQLLWLSLGVVIAIFFILSAAFGSSRDGLLIMLNLPLALIGGVLGVYLAGGVLSVASIVGFITLFGIATRNGIMLVSHIRHLQEQEGVTDFRTAVIRGAAERLVPILMTALAAGLALVPIALSAGEPGSEIQAPMAMVIMFGLASSTALNMIVVPDRVRTIWSTGGASAYRVGVTGAFKTAEKTRGRTYAQQGQCTCECHGGVNRSASWPGGPSLRSSQRIRVNSPARRSRCSRPEQHDLYDGHYVLSANRIHMVGGLNDPVGWDHMDNEAKTVKPVSGTAEIDVNDLTNTGTFEARLKIPGGRSGAGHRQIQRVQSVSERRDRRIPARARNRLGMRRQ